jgi:hypothetical protein
MIQLTDWSYHHNNENSFISKLNVNDMPNCAQADVNLGKGNHIFAYTKLNQQLDMIVSELTYILDDQEIASNKCDYSKKDERSKTSMTVYNPALTTLPFNSISDESEKLTLLFQTGAKTRHTIFAEIINSGLNYNSIISNVPNDKATVLKNSLIFSKSKLSLKVIQTRPGIYDCVQVFNPIYERELLFSPQLSQFNTCGNASNQNTMGVGQSSSGIASKLISNTNLLTTWQGKSLQTVNNIFWSASPTNLHNKEVSMCTSHRSYFNASCYWQEGYRYQILESCSAKTKNSQIQTDCLQKHYCTEVDCNECNRKINFSKGCEISDKKVDSVLFKPDVLLQKGVVMTENDVSTSLEQHNFEIDGSEPSNITRQKKLIGIDSLYDLHDFITENTDKTVTSFREHPIILSQKIRSFSQPSLPTYLLHNCTDDEQLSEDTEHESDSLSDTATACENIHHEYTSKLMGHLTEDIEENWQLEMPYSAMNVVCHETSPEYVTTQRVQMSSRPYSPDIICSNNFCKHLPGQDHTFPTSDPESVSNCGEDNYYQEQPMTQSRHNHNKMSQVHNSSPENTLHSCIDLAIKKNENGIHKQPCCTELQPTQDVTVQTNIRSLITLENENCCFVCFSNSDQFNNKDLKYGTRQNLALKRHIEALYLESVSLNKKQRYDTPKLIKSHISELPTNHASRSEKSDIIEDSFCDDDNEDINFKYGEYLPKVQDISVINTEHFVDFDRKVPNVGKDISWMDDDVNQRELYVTDQITKGKWTILFITMLNNLSSSYPSYLIVKNW